MNVDPDVVEEAARLVKSCNLQEDFIHPRLEKDWLAADGQVNLAPEIFEELKIFQAVLQRWHAASILPVGQLVLTIAQDIFHEPADLATAGRLSSVMEAAANDHPDWGLAAFAGELGEITANRRKFTGLSEEDSGFDPEKHRGKVIVSTVHKAKGLEFDRVYILSVNNYDYPSGLPQDQYISEKWFIEGRLNLEAETLYQLRALLKGEKIDLYHTGQATIESREEYIAERLRLLYVGITRARRELVITWNTGQQKNLTPALPLIALSEIWQGVLLERHD
jgi:DNA helicase-2/ATP-dependent DNA helicase PcrA